VNPPYAPTASFLDGIDVSHYQQAVNWPAVAASGIHFCFIKATDGGSFVDPNFTYNWQAAGQAGLMRSAYHFFRPAVPVTMQANLFLRTVSRLEGGDLPPVLDLEAPEQWASIPVLNRAALAVSWLEAVESGLYLRPIVYLSPAFMTEVLQNSDALAPYPLWLAQYTSAPAPSIPKPWTKWAFWQHTQQGTSPGISAPVDQNRFNGTLDDLKAMAVTAA
jgi:lysozyme